MCRFVTLVKVVVLDLIAFLLVLGAKKEKLKIFDLPAGLVRPSTVLYLTRRGVDVVVADL